MARVIEFPNRVNRNWRAIETTIRRTLAESHIPDHAIDEIAERMQPFVALCDRDIGAPFRCSIPGSVAPEQWVAVEEACHRFAVELEKNVHRLTSELLFDRLKVEVELYYLRAGR